MVIDRRIGILIIVAFVVVLLVAALANADGPFGPGPCPPGHGGSAQTDCWRD